MEVLYERVAGLDLARQRRWCACARPGRTGSARDAEFPTTTRVVGVILTRMSSEGYFPPPVLSVEIPKSHGSGARMLGIPRVRTG